MPDSDSPLFFHEAEVRPKERVRLDPGETEHAGRSLRLTAGDSLVLLDGKGRVSGCRVVEARGRRLDVLVVDTRVEPPPPGVSLWLGAAVVRGPRYDFVIEKATEIGVAGFLPVISHHTEVRPEREGAKLERWRRLAIAAMKQSRRVHLPEIRPPEPLETVLADPSFDVVWVADPGEVSGPPGLAGRKALLLVGPEGGWDPAERELLRQRGASFISLGPNRLRSETASISLLVLAHAAAGAMGLAG